MGHDECINEAECIKKFAILETKMTNIEGQNKKIIGKLDDICPAVKENSWWIDKIKCGFVLLAVTGLGLGIISWVWK